MKLKANRKKTKLTAFYLLSLIFLLSLFLRLYRLKDIPAAVWGDVIEHYKMTKYILEGKFFLIYLFGGDGPFFSYFNALLAKIFGLSFFTLKLSTAIIGSFLTLSIYLFTKAYFKKEKIALIASFLSAVSFWALSFSRQAKPHILVPLFTALTFYFYKNKKKTLTGVLLGLGMYTQAGFWGVPILFLLLREIKILFIGLGLSFPVLIDLLKNKLFLSNSFFGEKLAFAEVGLMERLFLSFKGFLKNFLAFFTTGDPVFRHTIPGQAHIDLFSRVFFLIGLILVFKRKRFVPLLSFFAVQIPSVLDIKNYFPNMGRMIGVLPFVFSFTALGINEVSEKLFRKRLWQSLFLGFWLGAIFLVNFVKYFYIYPKTLPNKNTPFGKIIAEYIKKYPKKNWEVFVVGCCWGEWGQPEPGAIKYRLKEKISFFQADGVSERPSCESIKTKTLKEGKRRFLLIIDPRLRGDLEILLENCKSAFQEFDTIKEGEVRIAEVVMGRL